MKKTLLALLIGMALLTGCSHPNPTGPSEPSATSVPTIAATPTATTITTPVPTPTATATAFPTSPLPTVQVTPTDGTHTVTYRMASMDSQNGVQFVNAAGTTINLSGLGHEWQTQISINRAGVPVPLSVQGAVNPANWTRPDPYVVLVEIYVDCDLVATQEALNTALATFNY